MAVEPGPQFSVQDCHNGYVEAFVDLGCDVVDLNYSDRLTFYATAGRVDDDTGEFVRMVPNPVDAVRMASKGIEAACFEFWPDVMFVSSCFFLPVDLLNNVRSRGIRIVINHVDSPYEDDRQSARAEYADLNLVNDPTNIDAFPNGTVYMPAAYRPTVHHRGPANPELVSEFAFAGTMFPSRVEFFEKVDFDGVDVAFAGNWQGLPGDHPLLRHVVHEIKECFDNTDTADLYRSTLTSANLYRIEADRPGLKDGWACGPREIEMAACGLWFARQARPESDDLFPMLPTFETPAELGEQIRWALAHPEWRQQAAQAALAAIVDRTFTANAERVLALLDRQ